MTPEELTALRNAIAEEEGESELPPELPLPPPYTLPARTLRALAGTPSAVSSSPPTLLLGGVWTGSSWTDQWFVGGFALGTLPHGRGAECVSASGLRFVPRSHLLPTLPLLSPSVAAALRAERAPCGPLFLLLDSEGRVLELTNSPPGGAVLALLEGVRPGGLSQWTRTATPPLLESWSVSLVLSRFPWPGAELAGMVQLPSLPPPVVRHIWTPHQWGQGTISTLLGFVTAWSTRLHDACARAELTARAVNVPQIQFRSGLHGDLLRVYESLLTLGLISREA